MSHPISIRRSTVDDIEVIMPIYRRAVEFMRRTGNMHQWTGGYPSLDVIAADIAAGNHYLGSDPQGNAVMVFTFILGNDPTYSVIEDGSWLNDDPYGTIHRIASTGHRGGMLEACVAYCRNVIDNIRIDTHANNGPMLQAIARVGFQRCGIIHIADGSPRIAFQLPAARLCPRRANNK